MDPLTVISLASSLITFVDFASKIVKGTYEVYSSTTGTSADNAHINRIIVDLQDVAADLDTDTIGKSKQERAMKDLASKCSKVSDDLLLLLNNIKSKGSPSTLKSLKSVYASIRKQKEITGLEKRLDDYRSQILIRLTIILQDQTCAVKMQLDKLENVTLNMSSESALRAKTLRKNILQDIEQLLESKAVPVPQVVATSSSGGLLDLKRDLLHLSSLAIAVPRENVILEDLYFESLDSRERAIVDAENGTFGWLFVENVVHKDVKVIEEINPPDLVDEHTNCAPRVVESQSCMEEKPRPGSPDIEWHDADTRYLEDDQFKRRAETRARFLVWLNSGGGVFHISGKAGSGKSTFMKFICSHTRTEEELSVWAGNKKLVFCAFYFWKSQDEMQMSIEGLCRSILFTTLRQCPELIPLVFPTHWERLKNERSVVGRFISYSDLIAAFEALTSTATFHSHRFCYFVDGLDEYHGHSLDHVRLVKSLQRWAGSSDVKICASSRPYIEYEKLSPSSDQILQLHLLTRHDIHLFCRQMIEKDDNFEQIKGSYLDLVTRIVRRSKGVFLWARLVVNSLLVGMLRHDNFETLKKKLSVVPGDINQLYDQLLNSLDDDDRERAIKLLLLTAHPPYDFTIVTYWMFDNFDPLTFKPSNETRPKSWPSNEQMAHDAQLQIKSLTKGLLEIQTRNYRGVDVQVVDFFHRTAQDFVLERLESAKQKRSDPGDEVIDRIIDKQSFALLRLAELTSYDTRTRKVVWQHHFALWVFRFTPNISLDVMDRYRILLEDFDGTKPDYGDDEVFLGYELGSSLNIRMHRLSFVHLAAYTGQLGYVLRETVADESLLKELSILASAIAGGNIELAKTLMERGCSPADSIKCWYQANSEDRPDGTITIWMAVLQHEIGTFLNSADRVIIAPGVLLAFELLFAHPDVNVRNCFMLLALPGRNSATHIITLQHFIQQLESEHTERLLAILDKKSDRPWVGAAKQFLSLFIPTVDKPNSSLPMLPIGYIPYSVGENKEMTLKAIVCDGIQVDECRFRAY